MRPAMHNVPVLRRHALALADNVVARNACGVLHSPGRIPTVSSGREPKTR